jgi:hypothetical protein
MRRPARRLPLIAAIVALAGCGGEHSMGRATVPGLSPQLLKVTFDPSVWHTDFVRHSVPLTAILPGGPPPDGIPPIDHPRFVPAAAADRFLAPREPVIAVARDGRARAYPLQILVWHEIVNDTLDGAPITVTYCPLCNSAIVFDRRAAGRSLTFGTTGNLLDSDLVMWDRQTESWWRQFDGTAIVGSLTGTRLTAIASQTLSFADFGARYPDGEVLARPTGFNRPYGYTPYYGYDSPESERPAFYSGRLDPRLPPVERVESITIGADTGVVPFNTLQHRPVLEAELDGVPLVVLFDPRILSPLDQSIIRNSRSVGGAAAFDRRLSGRTLDFQPGALGSMIDTQTGSRWDITGRAIAGPLRGAQLRRVRDLQAFWFAVAAFLPHPRLLMARHGL